MMCGPISYKEALAGFGFSDEAIARALVEIKSAKWETSLPRICWAGEDDERAYQRFRWLHDRARELT